MTGTEVQSSKWKSVWAVLAGLIVIVILSSAVDAIMHVTGIFPAYGQAMSSGLFAWATIYRVIISIFGCYLTARLAPTSGFSMLPRQPMMSARSAAFSSSGDFEIRSVEAT